MGRGGQGRPKKPTAVAELEGYRKDRIQNAPIPSGNIPTAPPDDLAPAALEEWHRLGPDLIRQGVLKPWDTQAFAKYCDAVARHWQAVAMLEEEGAVIEVPAISRSTGQVLGVQKKVNPWWTVYKDTSAEIARWAARFGLTPSDRAALGLDGSQKATPGEDLLSG